MKRRTISAYTLGCKVNQYDTSAMLEEFILSGYDILPFGEKTDVVLINTCTVTGTGENKSLKMIRRCFRETPHAAIIVAGCLAQREAEMVAALDGVRLVVGTKKREGVVRALEKALETSQGQSIVESLDGAVFEDARIDAAESKTRAVLKIQEGCANKCSYCAIPLARGPVRSRSLESIKSEVKRLADGGYAEIILAGIHLNSYGRDNNSSMTEAVVAALESVGENAEKSARIRLGSLEPGVHYREFAQEILDGNLGERLCPQFHLSLQSGSDSVLSRMRRRYSTDIYRKAVADLREFFPGCAITTDIIAGFPGETEEEFAQTLAFVEEIGFARVHAFPYSERSGTEAASMSGKISVGIRQNRAGAIINAAEKTAEVYLNSKIGHVLEVIFEETDKAGNCAGYCQHYLRCVVNGDVPKGVIARFLASESCGGVLYGEVL